MQMDLECVIQSEVSQKEKKQTYNMAYMWNLEKSQRLTHWQSRNRQMQRPNLPLPRGKRGGWMNWETGIGMYTPLCVKQITKENLLGTTGSSTQCSGRSIWEGNPKNRGYMYTSG